MLLKPNFLNQKTETSKEIAEILNATGLTTVEPRNKSLQTRREQLSEYLESSGASLKRVALALGNMLDDDEKGVQAARLILEAQGLTKDSAQAQIPSVTINFQSGKHSANLIELVMPNA